MIEREYYPLWLAAKNFRHSENDLIHFGAIGKLPIYALLTNLHLVRDDGHDRNDEENERFPYKFISNGPVRLGLPDIAKLEAYEEPDCLVVDKVDSATGERRTYKIEYGPRPQGTRRTNEPATRTVQLQDLVIMHSDLNKLLGDDDRVINAKTAEIVNNGKLINWVYWVGQMSTLTAEQAARLMNALDPDIFEKSDAKLNSPVTRAKDMKRLAENQGMTTATPRDWLDWANAHRLPVHYGFCLAVDEFPKDAPTEPASQSETPAERRKKHDITTERGCRRQILENWENIEKLHGPGADGRQVRKIVINNLDPIDKKPALKTVQNHLTALRKEGLIP